MKASNVGLKMMEEQAASEYPLTYMPQNKTHFTRTMPMKRHKPIAKLFETEFWGMQ